LANAIAAWVFREALSAATVAAVLRSAEAAGTIGPAGPPACWAASPTAGAAESSADHDDDSVGAATLGATAPAAAEIAAEPAVCAVALPSVDAALLTVDAASSLSAPAPLAGAVLAAVADLPSVFTGTAAALVRTLAAAAAPGEAVARPVPADAAGSFTVGVAAVCAAVVDAASGRPNAWANAAPEPVADADPGALLTRVAGSPEMAVAGCA
jgi:hypothetical protein